MTPDVVELVERARRAGLDLAAAARVGAYNAAVAQEHRLDDLGDGGHLVLVLGNSRALWPRFLAALREEPARLGGPDPLERWIEEVVAAAAATLRAPHVVRYAHDLTRVLAVQRLAHLTGLAWLAPSHLCVHPTFGPWIALRAAVVVAVPGPAAAPASDPCGQCAARCLPGLTAAQATPPGPEAWRAWLALRDACPLGREHRYGEAQLRYHYTKDPETLRREVVSQ